MSLAWLFADRAVKSKLSKPIELKNIHVATPCRADWAKMSGDERVRHCSECKLNVYNLSEMSRRQAEELIANREGRLCVRFYRRADGTILTRDCPVGIRQLVGKVSRIAGTVLSALMSVSFCAAQSTPQNAPQATTQKEQKTTGAIITTVTDPSGAVVSRTEVNLLMTSTGKWFSAKTDKLGTAKFTGLKPGTYEVRINSQGFKDYRADISVTEDRTIQINAKLVVGEVLVGVVLVTDDNPLVNKTDSSVTHTFSGDLLKAVTPH